MNCTQFEEILADLNRPGTRAAALREGALAHADSCNRCAELLAEAQSLDRALRALTAQEAGLQAPARVEANLLREFRRQKTAGWRRKVRWQAAAIGIAAAMLLAVGASLYHRIARSSGSGSVTQTPAAGPVLPLTANSTEHSAPAVIQPQPAASAVPAKHGGSVESALSSEPRNSEDSATFIPLPYADDPAAVDEGAVVRVVLSRATLASFGLTEAPEMRDDSVSADLLVSEDGTPQAIRLVPQ
jgi:hypothetical protein